MVQPEIGIGEAAERASKQRRWIIIGALFACGLAVGFFSAFLEEGDKSGVLSGTLPPVFALAAAAVTLIAMIGGSLLYHRRMDELERRENLICAAWGGNAILLAYPVWFILWKGRWVPEPDHLALYGLVFAVSLITYTVRKLRTR
jgi:hypothetical protein